MFINMDTFHLDFVASQLISTDGAWKGACASTNFFSKVLWEFFDKQEPVYENILL